MIELKLEKIKLLLLIDEIEQLSIQNETVIYNLLNWLEINRNLALIGITNEPQFFELLP